jgi:uncharacterized protein with von Willebrand factor type A (vWA) domain
MIVKKRENYLDLTDSQIKYYNHLYYYQINIGDNPNQISIDTIIDIQRAQTHPFLGDGFFIKENMNTNGKLGFKKLLQSVNFDIYTGNTIAEKAINVAAVYQNYLNNESVQQGQMGGQGQQQSDQQQQFTQTQNQQTGNQQQKQQGQQGQSEGKEQQINSASDQPNDINSQMPKRSSDDPKGNESPSNDPITKDDDVSSKKFNQKTSNNKFNNISEVITKVEEKIQYYRDRMQAVEMLDPGVKTPEQAVHTLSKENQKILSNLSIVRAEGKLKSKKPLHSNKGTRMDNYGQITKLYNKTAFVKPDFKHKLMHKELNVRKPIRYGSQALMLLIDDSGSMSTVPKQTWVKTMLVHHLLEVKNKGAVLYIVSYVTNLTQALVIKKVTENTLNEIYNQLSFNNGTTDIESCIKKAEQCIVNKRVLNVPIEGERPQILILLDGEDAVNPFKPMFPTHAFVLGNSNEGLKTVIDNSKGIYKEFKL